MQQGHPRNDAGRAGLSELCVRCDGEMQTDLAPRWVRWSAVCVMASLVGSPLAAPVLAADPFFAFVGYSALGVALGPSIAVLRAHGNCWECKLERPDLALRRMGLRRYLMVESKS